MEHKKMQWIKRRHRIVRDMAFALLSPYSKWKYGVVADRFREQGDRSYLILMNHQTPFDQFFVGMSFRGAVYYLATEDVFSNGWVSSLVRWLVAPIPIKKQTTDLSAVRNCIRVAKEGGTIVIAPEGNRTYSGKTEYMNPSIASLARMLKLPIALYRIEGGYGVQPRWSDVIRKGRIHSYVSRVIEPEEYQSMSNDELFDVIRQELFVDDRAAGGSFLSPKRAEYLERAIYVCPWCGLSTFHSSGNVIECKTCHRKIEYGADMKLRGMGFRFPFDYVADWYEHQNTFINDLDVTRYIDKPLYTDTSDMFEVILYQRKVPLRSAATVCLYGDRVVIDGDSDEPLVFPFSEVTAVSVLGRNKLNIYHKNKVYQFKGEKRFNALKYVNIYFCHKNISRGNENGKFLGI